MHDDGGFVVRKILELHSYHINCTLFMFILKGLQNSAASCTIVAVLCLATSAVIGVFGIAKKQASACMVTGVLYCIAGNILLSNLY